MARKVTRISVLILGMVLLFSRAISSQGKTDANSSTPANRPPEYPENEVGMLIQAWQWISISPEVPSKTHARHGLAAALSYGAVSANVISEYAGAHAAVQISPRKLVICVCGLISLPGSPALVRLHGKKETRELDGGRLQPFRGKVSEAQKNDLVPIDVSHPERMVWLVQSTAPLSPGEYALMLGTQNVSLFPFTVTDKPAASPASSESN